MSWYLDQFELGTVKKIKTVPLARLAEKIYCCMYGALTPRRQRLDTFTRLYFLRHIYADSAKRGHDFFCWLTPPSIAEHEYWWFGYCPCHFEKMISNAHFVPPTEMVRQWFDSCLSIFFPRVSLPGRTRYQFAPEHVQPAFQSRSFILLIPISVRNNRSGVAWMLSPLAAVLSILALVGLLSLMGWRNGKRSRGTYEAFNQ